MKYLIALRGQGRPILEAAEMIQARIGGAIETLPHDEFYPNQRHPL